MSRLVPSRALALAGLLALAPLAACVEGGGQLPAPDPGPSRTYPVPGTRGPSDPAPQGSLPNPYTNPQ